MKLATGAPCAGHGAMFAPWPGPETDVERWYLLESGRAVGVSGAESAAPRFASVRGELRSHPSGAGPSRTSVRRMEETRSDVGQTSFSADRTVIP